jgi:hypothetical protein
MQYFEGKLYVFGGIHDITWELDDLHIYNLTVLFKLKYRNINGQLSNKIRQEKWIVEKIQFKEIQKIKLKENRSQRRRIGMKQ